MGKPSAPTVGYHYHLAAHFIITPRKVNGFLAFNGGSKVAWSGVVTESGTVHVDAPNLWGGEKDQGGIVTDMSLMFGDDDQPPNPYLVATFGSQTCAWRGWTSVSLNGGRYGAMNPYPQKPSWKFWRTTAGWDGDECWYPEKCEILMTDSGDLSDIGYPPVLIDRKVTVTSPSITQPAACVLGMAVQYGWSYTLEDDAYYFWRANESGLLLSKEQEGISTDLDAINVLIARGWELNQTALVKYFNGDLWMTVITPGAGSDPPPAPAGHTWIQSIPDPGAYDTALGPVEFWRTNEATTTPVSLRAINPAHVLYETLTAEDMGREPVERINDDSFTAAADTLYAEGFGICPSWDTGSESLEDYRARIQKLIAGSLNRSLEDGQWYLDLARGDYDIDDLPILTDDDILDFKQQVATLDNAINSVAVKWLDPETNTRKTTAPVRALGLIRQFGTIHQVYDYPEIPTEALALRVAQRELMATTTPTHAFDCAWKPGKVYKLRPNQYFRLQAPKRGIADMVCIVGEKQHGTLKSGAIKMKAVQDIYGMPSTAFSQAEPGIDTRPPQVPNAIAHERAIEAPYVELVGAMTRADLQALPDDVGFAMGVAVQPDRELNFTMVVDGVEAGNGDWCASATVNEAAGITSTAFTLANGKRLDAVTVGMAALWDDEIVRVDAIDADAGTITLGRGCADTVPAAHAANRRLFFYDVGFAYDTTEYTDGETVAVKLLPNTGSQQLPLASATPMPVEFNQRQARPYPPAKLRINDEAAPSYLFGELTVTWVHRDRVGQADQLVDTEAATVGPEAGTTYTMRTYLNDVLDDTQTGISGTTATVTPSDDGTVRIELESDRDGLTSWQAQVRAFAYIAAEREPLTIVGDAVTILGDPIYME